MLTRDRLLPISEISDFDGPCHLPDLSCGFRENLVMCAIVAPLGIGENPMRQVLRWAGALALVGVASVAAAQGVTVSVSPPNPSLQPNATQQFAAAVTGTTKLAVTWLVDGIRGGAPSIGTITPRGLYTAPAENPAAFAATIEAASNAAPQAVGQATANVAAAPPSGPTFFVATTGSDGNPGTAAAPWRTIQHAVNSVPAGATILVHGGKYNEKVLIENSGSAAAGFISIAPVPGEAPIVDGTRRRIPNGQFGLFTLQNVSYVRIEGFEIQNYVSRNTNVPIGIYVTGAGSHIELLHNHIHDIKTTLPTARGDALGIAVYGTTAQAAISDLIIDGNELENLKLGFSESLSLSGNVTQWQVTNNVIHDNDNIGINIEGYFKTVPNNPTVDTARNGLVAGNTVYNITSKNNPAYHGSLGANGIYVDGGSLVTIQQNVIHDTDIGLELASEVHTRATVGVIARNNLIYRNNLTGVSIGGADAVQNGGTTGCSIVNNTLFQNASSNRFGSGEFQVQFHAAENLFANNILAANGQGLLIYDPTAAATSPAVLSHNLYFSSAGSGASQWIWLGRTHTGFSAWSGTRIEPGAGYGSPQFANTGTLPDLHVAATSPAIGHGVDFGLVRVGPVDFAGNPRTIGTSIDIGAYEH
jgi:hypothetical protein